MVLDKKPVQPAIMIFLYCVQCKVKYLVHGKEGREVVVPESIGQPVGRL